MGIALGEQKVMGNYTETTGFGFSAFIRSQTRTLNALMRIYAVNYKTPLVLPSNTTQKPPEG
jgi:hypothetical protein